MWSFLRYSKHNSLNSIFFLVELSDRTYSNSKRSPKPITRTRTDFFFGDYLWISLRRRKVNTTNFYCFWKHGRMLAMKQQLLKRKLKRERTSHLIYFPIIFVVVFFRLLIRNYFSHELFSILVFFHSGQES